MESAPISTSTNATLPWYKKRTAGWAYLALLPARRLLSLYLAVFFLFSVLGFYGEITYCGGRAPIWAVLIVASINGAYADLYPYVLIHKPKVYLYLLAIFNCVLGPVVATWLGHTAEAYPAHFTPRAGINLAAQGIMIAVVLSYIFFISFTREQASQALRIQNELDLAHGIQRTLVPPLRLSSSGYELNGVSIPSDKVGGDLVDIVPLANGATLAYVADVSGHGLQAGILMGMVKTAIRTILLEDFATPELLLHTLCDRLNRALPGVKEAHMYTTLSAIYFAPDGQAFYVLAGHSPILHFHSATASVEPLGSEEFPIGLIPVARYQSSSVFLQPGDILAISTDGILEATDSKDEEFGSARVASLLASTTQTGHSLTASEALEQTSQAIMQAVRAFGPQADDQTLLFIQREPGEAGYTSAALQAHSPDYGRAAGTWIQ